MICVKKRLCFAGWRCRLALSEEPNRKSSLKELGVSKGKQVLDLWHRRIQSDKALAFPHRKILDVSMGQYSFTTNQFVAVHFSRLVKLAHIGKNMAKRYLSLLRDKVYVDVNDDGYRKWFRMRSQEDKAFILRHRSSIKGR